jgi:DNA-binding transcriptional regulator YiaG
MDDKFENLDELTVEVFNSPSDKEKTARAFRLLRYATGLNRKELSEYLHIPYNTIRDWEQGKRAMPPYVFELILYKLRKENIIIKQ